MRKNWVGNGVSQIVNLRCSIGDLPEAMQEMAAYAARDRCNGTERRANHAEGIFMPGSICADKWAVVLFKMWKAFASGFLSSERSCVSVRIPVSGGLPGPSGWGDLWVNIYH